MLTRSWGLSLSDGIGQSDCAARADRRRGGAIQRFLASVVECGDRAPMYAIDSTRLIDDRGFGAVSGIYVADRGFELGFGLGFGLGEAGEVGFTNGAPISALTL